MDSFNKFFLLFSRTKIQATSCPRATTLTSATSDEVVNYFFTKNIFFENFYVAFKVKIVLNLTKYSFSKFKITLCCDEMMILSKTLMKMPRRICKIT
jgi:hypothetical protein